MGVESGSNVFRFAPCRECCVDGCLYLRDTFDGDALAETWTENSGSWSVSGSSANTSSANALLTNSAENPLASNAHVASTIVTGGDGDQAKIVANFVDTDNYWYARAEFGAINTEVRLFERSGGSDTQRGVTRTTGVIADGELQIGLCVRENGVYAVQYRDAGDPESVFVLGPTFLGDVPTSTKGGIGTGDNTGTISFRSVNLSKHDDDEAGCAVCPVCLVCVTNATTAIFVELADMADDTDCSDCDEYDDTFTLPATFNECVYFEEFEGGDAPCSDLFPSALMTWTVTFEETLEGCKVTVQLLIFREEALCDVCREQYLWIKESAESFDLSDWIEVAFDSQNLIAASTTSPCPCGGIDFSCDASGTTLRIKAA